MHETMLEEARGMGAEEGGGCLLSDLSVLAYGRPATV